MNLQELSNGAGQSDERSASVKNGTGRLELGRLVAKGDGVKVNLPVSLTAERNFGHGTSVVVLVDTTKHGLGLNTLVLGVAEIEREDRLIEQTLLDGRVEWGNNTIDADGVVAETQDTVKAAKGKSQTGLRGSLTEQLVLDLEVTNLKGVLGDVSLYSSRAIANGEIGAVLLVR